MTIYTIQVEEKHIEDGIPQCSTGCAVAKAINEKLGKIFNLDDEFSYHFESGICESGDGFNLRLADNKPFAYQTFFDADILNEDQQRVNNFVEDFDDGKDVSPFDFNISIDDKSIEKMKALAKKENENFKIKK
jgi:hypothetical protein